MKRLERGPWLLALVCCAAVEGQGCAQYTGTGLALAPNALVTERGWLGVRNVPILHQRSELDCGPTALAMVLAHYQGSAQPAQALGFIEDRRYAAAELRDRARALGFSAFVVAGTFEDIIFELEHGRPAIVGMAKPTLKGNLAHYEVVVGLHRATRRVATIDPALGFRQNSLRGFVSEWVPAGQTLIVVLGRATAATAAMPPTTATATAAKP